MWILLITLTLPIVTLADLSCSIIDLANNQRALALCKKFPTPQDWAHISGNQTRRLTLENIEGDILKPPLIKDLYVEDLKIKSSIIGSIDENFFSSLSNNLISISMEKVTTSTTLGKKHFEGLQNKLETLVLHHGINLKPDALVGMRNLRELSIKDSPISSYPINLPELLRQGLKKINLEKTKIQSLPWGDVIQWSKSDVGSSNGELSFKESPLHCDETVAEFRNILVQQQDESKFVGFKCASPARFKNRYLRDISVEELRKVIEEAPPLPEDPSDTISPQHNTNSESEASPIDPEKAIGKSSFSLIALAVLGGIVVFVLILIIAAIVVKRARSRKYKGHTNVKKEPTTEDPLKDPMLHHQQSDLDHNHRRNLHV